MRRQRASGRILASMAIVLVGAIIGVIIFSWDSVFAPSGGMYSRLVIDSVHFVEPVSVGNAKWRIELFIRNEGNNEVKLNKVYVSRKLVEAWGVKPGDALSSSSTTGCSIPKEGLIIKPRTSETISVWIGGDLYSSGSIITLHILNPDILEYTRQIKLR